MHDHMVGHDVLAWQPLECLLSVYVDMIESGKAVAIHRYVKNAEDYEFVKDPVTGESHYQLASLTIDPLSGLTRSTACIDPWLICRYTDGDVAAP